MPLLAGLWAFTGGCSDNVDPSTTTSENNKDTAKAKYIFLFVGDGLASPQVNVTEAALGMSSIDRNEAVQAIQSGALAKKITLNELNMSMFPVDGSATTYAQDRYITGSAASATALATGSKTTIGTIAKNGDHSQSLTTMAETAKKKGLKVGIVSSVSIDHATPAAFYAHSDSRNYYNYIAAQMATSGFDYFGGGYAKGDWEKYRAASRNPANYTALDIPTAMRDSGYTITTTRSSLNSAVAQGGKIWAYSNYDSDGALLYDVDRSSDDITLAEFTQAGIDLMDDNEKGFFMMVEGGKIDWALHANDVVSAIGDMIAFDEALGKAIAFYNEHPDSTLIVVTGDHECGGLTIGAAGSGYENSFELLQTQKISFSAFDEVLKSFMPADSATKADLLADSVALDSVYGVLLDSIAYYFGLGNLQVDSSMALSEYEQKRLYDSYLTVLDKDLGVTLDENYLKYGGYNPISVTVTHVLNEKAGITFTSYSHTAVPVPVYALGAGQELFDGSYDNTDIAKFIMEVGNLSAQ